MKICNYWNYPNMDKIPVVTEIILLCSLMKVRRSSHLTAITEEEGFYTAGVLFLVFFFCRWCIFMISILILHLHTHWNGLCSSHRWTLTPTHSHTETLPPALLQHAPSFGLLDGCHGDVIDKVDELISLSAWNQKKCCVVSCTINKLLMNQSSVIEKTNPMGSTAGLP